MSDWDAIFGEAALGLDPAKADLVLAGPGQAPARRSQRPSAQTQPSPARPGRPGRPRPAQPPHQQDVMPAPGKLPRRP
jgi:hypothetical protein